jgi:mRNA interferase MazF
MVARFDRDWRVREDVVDLDIGLAAGREAGFRHPAVVVTAQRILDALPCVIHVVPSPPPFAASRQRSQLTLTKTTGYAALVPRSASTCEHCRPGGSKRSAATSAQPSSARSEPPSA